MSELKVQACVDCRPCYRSKLNDAIVLFLCDLFQPSGPARCRPCAVACPHFISVMFSRKDQLDEDVRFRIMRLLVEDPELSQRELANAVGVSVGRVHYLLNALVERGLVKFGKFSASDDKRRYAYILTPKGAAEKASITTRFLARKLGEYEALKREISELKAEIMESRRDQTAEFETGERGA